MRINFENVILESYDYVNGVLYASGIDDAPNFTEPLSMWEIDTIFAGYGVPFWSYPLNEIPYICEMNLHENYVIVKLKTRHELDDEYRVYEY